MMELAVAGYEAALAALSERDGVFVECLHAASTCFVRRRTGLHLPLRELCLRRTDPSQRLEVILWYTRCMDMYLDDVMEKTLGPRPDNF